MRYVNAVVEWAIRKPWLAGLLAVGLLVGACAAHGGGNGSSRAEAPGASPAPSFSALAAPPDPTVAPAPPTDTTVATVTRLAQRFLAVYLNPAYSPAQRALHAADYVTADLSARLATTTPIHLPGSGAPTLQVTPSLGGATVYATRGGVTLDLTITASGGPLQVAAVDLAAGE